MLKKLKNIFKNEKDSADNSNTIEPSQNVNISPYWRSGDIRIKLDRPAVKHFERYRFAAELLNNLNCKEICDIACGSGYGSWILSGLGMKSTGMDIEEDVIVYANKTFANERAAFFVGNVTDIALKDSTFDAVISFETIEHVEFPEKAVEECRRILKPGGYFIFSIPINHPDLVYHKKIYSLADTKSLIENFQWADIEYYNQGADSPIIKPQLDSVSTLIGICKKPFIK